MFEEIDEILQENTRKISALINSDSTRRWYWSTLQAEVMHVMTQTIEELLKFDNPTEAMRVYLDRLSYGMQLVDRRNPSKWSMRQVDIAFNGGPISTSIIPKSDGELERVENKPNVQDLVEAFRDQLEYSGSFDGADSDES